jgi:hypothetical protein
MIKEIDGLQYLYTKDAKAVVTEEKKRMLCLYLVQLFFKEIIHYLKCHLFSNIFDNKL